MNSFKEFRPISLKEIAPRCWRFAQRSLRSARHDCTCTYCHRRRRDWGLALASMLADQRHAVTVFDQFETPQPVGSGLIIQPIGAAVLDCVGAGDAARAKGNAIHRMLGHVVPSERRVLDVHYDPTHRVQTGLAIHRASLFDALFQAAKGRPLRLKVGPRSPPPTQAS